MTSKAEAPKITKVSSEQVPTNSLKVNNNPFGSKEEEKKPTVSPR